MDEEDQKCLECDKDFKESEEIIKCNGLCKKHYHPKCIGFTPVSLKFYRECDNLIYVCDQCQNDPLQLMNVTLKKLLSFMCIFNERLNRQEINSETMFKQFDLVNKNIEDLATEISQSEAAHASNMNTNSTLIANTTIVQETFAEVTKKPLIEPIILVKPKITQRCYDTRADLKSKGMSDEFQISSVNNIPKGGLEIKCNSVEEQKKFHEKVTKELVELSFKKLESGESSGEVVNQCCHREPKYITVATGFNEGEAKLDVGQCRQKCIAPTVKPLKREEFDKYLKQFPDIDPIQIFLTLQSKDSTKPDLLTTPEENNENSDNQDLQANSKRISTSCLQSLCLPSSVKRESYYDLSGEVTEIDVIESCECLSPPQQGCQRYPSTVKVHVNTPYEREVDIGQCIGSCDDNSSDDCLSCRPIRNRTTSLEGPNGAQCLTVIDECQCVGECYRVRQFLKVYDYTNTFTAKSSLMNTLYNSSANNNTASQNEDKSTLASAQMTQLIDNSSLEPVTKVIDIGMCNGSCSDVPLASKCLLWSSSDNGTCLSTLTGGASKCTATKFVSHSYMDVHGKKHTIVSVTGCGCH